MVKRGLVQWLKLLLLCAAAISAGQVVGADFAAQWTGQRALGYFPDGPGRRAWTNLSFNPRSGKLMLFGGASGQYFWDVWEYETLRDTWTPLEQPANNCPGYNGFDGPDGRDGQTVAYDPYNNLLWSVGGSGYKCGHNTSIGRSPARTVAEAPNALTLVDRSLRADLPVDYYKDWAVIANDQVAYVRSYDPATRTLFLATPLNRLVAGSTYELRVWGDSGAWYYSPDQRRWRSLDGPHWGYSGERPDWYWLRDSVGFAYSSADRALLMFGGSLNGRSQNDTWKLDLTSRSQAGHPATWVRQNANNPDNRALPFGRNEISNALVYDSRNDVFVLFGGRCNQVGCPSVALADTWQYKLSTNTWTQMRPLVSPPARLSHLMYYDSQHGVVVLFGGTAVDYYAKTIPPNGYFNDLWVYDVAKNTWAEIPAPVLRPGGRIAGSLAYDPVAQAAVLYGGITSTDPASFEVWKLTLARTSAPNNIAPVAVARVLPASGGIDTLFGASAAGSFDPDGTVASYLWNFGDGSSATGQTATHRYAAAGRFNVTLTVTDNSGGSTNTASVVTVVAGNPAPQIGLRTVTLGGTVSDGSISRVTVNGAAVPVSGGAFQATVPLAGASTTITIQATNAAGSSSTRTVRVDAP